MRHAWVYILECSDGWYYTGSTTDIEGRIAKHQAGFYDGYTSARLPVRLKWSAEVSDINAAIAAERQIKGWSRKKKEALTNGDYDLLHEPAQSKEVRDRQKNRQSP